MNIKDARKLENGQKVVHNRYGECIVKEVMISMGELFGVVITPDSENGRRLLRLDTGTDIQDYLEAATRRLSVAGAKPIDLETAWGESEGDLPDQGPKNHFDLKNEQVQ